jgi:NAD-dependent dihydropyrimidine dehydrogenase PreA subunit
VKHRFAVKAGVFLFVFLLVSAGRWFASRGAGFAAPVFTAGSYGLFAAGIAVFVFDLVLVRSLLQRKIFCIQILWIALITLAVVDGIVELSWLAAGIILLLSVALFLFAVVFDGRCSRGPDFLMNRGQDLPDRYLRPRPLKTAAETLLRLFPFPEPVGLYRIGSAGADSPVLVTGNFEMTLRRVCSAVKDIDCWLLVCDSRGINVWCASLAGHFTTDSVVQAIARTGLVERVRDRRLILPQLCASSVSLEALQEQTGFRARFGPLCIRDLAAFRENPSDPALRTAHFPLGARLEMALGSPLIVTILVVLVYNFIGARHLAVLLPLLYLCSLVHGVIFPRRPIRRIGPWALLYGAALFMLTGLFSRAFFPEHVLLYALTVGFGAAYLVTEFSGWSPLLKYNLIPHRKSRVEVDQQNCTGCRRCVEVCPRAVFQMEGKRSLVVGENRCVTCRSCFSQCPSGAVRHDHASL